MDSLTPNIFVKDMNATIAFYQLLGFNVVMSVPGEGDFVWAMMVCGNVSMMFQTFESLAEELPRSAERMVALYYFTLRSKHPDILRYYQRKKSMC